MICPTIVEKRNNEGYAPKGLTYNKPGTLKSEPSGGLQGPFGEAYLQNLYGLPH